MRGLAPVLCGGLGLLLTARSATAATPVVEGIEWSGTHALSPGEIAPYLFTHERPVWRVWLPRPPFDESVLEADMRRIEDVYREHGRYQARASYTLAWNRKRTGVRIRIEVSEGKSVRLERFEVDLTALPADEADWRAELLADLPLRKGRVFTLDDYGAAKRTLLERLADRGRPDARVEGGGEVDVARRTARVTWHVEPGPRVRFGPVRVEGLERVRETLVLETLTFAPGERYDADALRRSQARLSRMGLFRSVLLVPEAREATPGEEIERPVVVQVEERPPRRVRLGVGWGTEDRLRLQAGWTHRNLLGRADPLDVRGRWTGLVRELEVSLLEPRLPDAESAVRIESKLGSEKPPAYDARLLASRLGVERAFGEHWSGRLAYRLEWADVGSVPEVTRRFYRNPEDRYWLGSFELAVSRDGTDDPLDPRRGTWLELTAEPAVPWLGSAVRYLRLTAEGRAFAPLGPLVLATRARLGTIDAFGASQRAELPVTKLFYAGGSNSMRGYAYQHLGPREAQGDAVGGSSLLLLNTELRFPIWRALGGVAFVDAGQLDLDAWHFRPRDLRVAVGGGLRVSTPLGPARVDVGFPTNAPENKGGYQLWLSIGQAF